MNNEQFRKLLIANAAKASSADQNGPPATGSRQSGTALGSRLKSSIPMTPRAVSGRVDFARQLAERGQGGQQQQKKKFRTSAPRGSKFAEGYVDRAKTRHEVEEDERAERLQALEECLKKEEIDQATYDKLRSQIAGGDLSSTHLVKGLDFKLLERVRKGEDVYHESEAKSPKGEPGSEPEEDPDDILDELEAHEVKPMAKEKVQKKGQFAPASLVPGQKRSRNQILAEMKAAREEAARAKEQSALGSRFKKIGARQKAGSRIERDSKGREVLIIVDEDGNERRKVRKLDPSASKENGKEAFKPDKNAEVLGMEVPEFYKKQQLEKAKEEEEKEKEKEFNIFDDAGSDYDPLSGLKESDDEESSEEEGEAADKKATSGKDKEAVPPPPPGPQPPSGPRNYFKDSKMALQSAEPARVSAMSDPTILAALKKVRALDKEARSEEELKAAEREARLKKMLQNSNRDDEDLDVDFGTSRLEDEADAEDAHVKLSAWGGGGDDDGPEGGKSKRKRGPKKRKGDKNSVADVMRVIDRRKGSDA